MEAGLFPCTYSRNFVGEPRQKSRSLFGRERETADQNLRRLLAKPRSSVRRLFALEQKDRRQLCLVRELVRACRPGEGLLRLGQKRRILEVDRDLRLRVLRLIGQKVDLPDFVDDPVVRASRQCAAVQLHHLAPLENIGAVEGERCLRRPVLHLDLILGIGRLRIVVVVDGRVRLIQGQNALPAELVVVCRIEWAQIGKNQKPHLPVDQVSGEIRQILPRRNTRLVDPGDFLPHSPVFDIDPVVRIAGEVVVVFQIQTHDLREGDTALLVESFLGARLLPVDLKLEALLLDVARPDIVDIPHLVVPRIPESLIARLVVQNGGTDDLQADGDIRVHRCRVRDVAGLHRVRCVQKVDRHRVVVGERPVQCQNTDIPVDVVVGRLFEFVKPAVNEIGACRVRIQKCGTLHLGTVVVVRVVVIDKNTQITDRIEVVQNEVAVLHIIEVR